MALSSSSRLIYSICQEAKWFFFDDDTTSSSSESESESEEEEEDEQIVENEIDVQIKNKEEPEKKEEEDENNEENEEEEKIFTIKNNRKKRKCVGRRVTDFYREVIPKYSPSDFQTHFRMTRQTLEILRRTLSDASSDTRHTGRPPIATDEKVLMMLWFLGSREAYRSVSDRFNVSTQTLFSTVMDMCKVLHAQSSFLVTWPDERRRKATARNIRDRTGFPGVLGAIDGTHIRIKAPREQPALYVNGNEFHSIILQAVCDDEMLFTSCYAGECGSALDTEVYARSPLAHETREKGAMLFPDDMHLVGDGSYDISPYMMTPFRDNGILTQKERVYNASHSAARNVIRRAFAHLRGRWRRLAFLDMSRMDLIPIVVIACCVLHNLCVSNSDVLSELQFVEEEEPNNYDDLIRPHTEQNLQNAGKIKQDLILNNVSFYEQTKTVNVI